MRSGAGFFAVSGYLITKSATSTGIVHFLWRRMLRIFPAFWTVLIVGASRWLGAACGVVMVVTLSTGGWFLLGYPAHAYSALWLASRLPSCIQWIGSKNDYSSGLYRYGFLVQQFTAFLGWHLLGWRLLGYWVWVVLTMAVTAGCAWLSWHVVEQPAMAWKDRGPGRGVAFPLLRTRPVPSSVDPHPAQDFAP